MTGKIKVAILGSTGMLGSMVRRYLSEQPAYDISVIDRPAFDAEAPLLQPTLSDFLHGHDYAINCIGVIKPRIDEQNSSSVECAIRVNSLFPHTLARAAEQVGCKVLQIATDCVYSGREGNYSENAVHDAADVYGKTKSLGEVTSSAVSNLRCSIIGPEEIGRPKDSLLEWFLGQPRGAMVKGFANHHWNGVTTLAFAKLCRGIMREGIELPSLQHIVPRNAVSKYSLLYHFSYFYDRNDVHIERVDAATAADRTLSTSFPIVNETVWKAAGYNGPPYIQQLIEEMAEYSRGKEVCQ